MSFLEEKWKEVIGGFILCVSMAIGIALVPDQYVTLRFYVILLFCFIIPYLWSLLRDGVEDPGDIKWARDIPFTIVQIALMPLAFVGCFAMIGGVIFLGLGSFIWDRDMAKIGIQMLLGGATPIAAMKGVSMLREHIKRRKETIYPWTARPYKPWKKD
jgi:hypothetical protein